MSVTGERLQPSLFERGRPGRNRGRLPAAPAGALDRIPAGALRATPPALPELDEPTLVRHYLNLSQLNWSVDGGFYPLGSCTMKFNPKVNEWAVRLPGLAGLHPLAPDETAQGTLAILWELAAFLAEIGGMDAVTLSPAAGAHGELTGILLFRAYHRSRGDDERGEILVPDSAHGTNPATASMAGYRTLNIASAADGGVDLDAFRAALGPRTAGVMITNPSTLGLFEARVVELVELVHAAGGLVYMDGANMNAVLGHFRPGAAGIDAMHFNVHKTFSTPHGGGGPGAGPVAVRSHLAPFLPGPLVVREADGRFRLERPGERPASIGRVRSFAGSTAVLVRAWAYIRSHGGDGLREVSEDAVLAANYLRRRLAATYDVP
ncbi:MAG: aminomethyl-transferring glycine dehydrogenase subunit GcvPB, partial [Chloroflexi bacterium]|nr:aminomethyl-transferring glycine dehydrogenase subunit GcvPB [Chloroflexota bacterium]